MILQGDIFLMRGDGRLQQLWRQLHKPVFDLAKKGCWRFNKPGNVLNIGAELGFIDRASHIFGQRLCPINDRACDGLIGQLSHARWPAGV